MKKSIILYTLVLSCAFSLNAQENAWTLKECLDYALENNIALKRQEISSDLSKKDYTQSKLNALPSLNGQAQHNMGAGRVLDESSYEWVNTDLRQGNLGLASSVTLFKGLQGYNNIKMMEAHYLAARENLKLVENNLMLQVMTGFLELMRNEELYEIAQEKAKITQQQVDRMSMMLDLGNAAAGDLLEVKAQASSEKYNATLAHNQLQMSILTLKQLLNLPEDKEFGISKPEIEDPNELQLPVLKDVYSTAINLLPQIKGAEYSIDYYNKNLAVARGALSPEIYARAYYNSNYNNLLPNPANPNQDYPISQQVLDNRYSQLSVGISVPIFNKWQARTNISKARLSLQDARYNLEDNRQQLLKEIEQYYTDARAALDNYKFSEESYANSEEAYNYAEERFKVGIATALEMAEARNRMYSARVEIVSSKYIFVFYIKVLDFYQGKELALDS